jgi:long-chain acyl-CoA synthetase
MSSSETIAQVFFEQSQKKGEAEAVRFKQHKSSYESLSWAELSALVKEIAYGLAALEIEPGQTVAIFSTTSYLWIACDLATICAGAISVALYPNSSSDDLEYILNHCQAKVVFASAELFPKLINKLDKIEHCKKIIYLPSLIKADADWSALQSKYESIQDKLIHLDQLRNLGSEFKTSHQQLIKTRVKDASSEDIATVIYTSGTTGKPKGVPLTHNNILSLLKVLPDILPVDERDIYFSYLPISHVFERVCGEYYWLFCGAVIAFAESMENMPKNMGEVEPTLMLAVPRVLDRIHIKINNGIKGASGNSRRLIEWAIAVGTEAFTLTAKKQSFGPLLKLKWKLAERLVLKKIRHRIGKRLRFIVTGGAPADQNVILFFHAIGIPVLEGYGLTETAAPTHVNRLNKPKLSTVGQALPSIDLKIAEDGEILVKGPSIFNGYFNDPESTKEAFTDGWFRTGDVGLIDDDGYLKITDRKKDIIVNAAGKNIAPQRIEGILQTIPLISRAIVFGDKRKHLVALLTIHEHAATELASDKGWNFENFEDLVTSKQLYQHIRKELNLKQHLLADYERVRRFAILPHDLSIESGELTASMKVKRNIVAQKFAETIDGLYKEEHAVTETATATT